MISAKATQDFVPIKEIRDGVIVTKDGSLQLILMASSLNIALKSEDEQAAIILQFQNFLNSLDFSLQIFIQSRKYDIRPYIALLEERERAQLNDLLKIQTREYISFIKSFTETTNIMSKNFFVVVPYAPSVLTSQKRDSSVCSQKVPLGARRRTRWRILNPTKRSWNSARMWYSKDSSVLAYARHSSARRK